MYCSFFGFSEKPFDVTPDPKFLYLSPGHRESLASLVYGIRERRGFISIVGEVGTGKTTLLNAALDSLDGKTKVAYIFNTKVTFEQMLSMALSELELGKADESLPKIQALDRLNDFAIRQLAQGGNVALIVDEAQNLDPLSMENLRLLSNLETRKHKLIQIVLAGQPELDTKMRQPELRQLAQRISLRRYIGPLSKEETFEYIQHRLTVAGCTGSSLFSHRARELIWEYSGGIPRKINILCDNAFLIGYGLKSRRIKAKEVDEAINDLSWSPFAGMEDKHSGTTGEVGVQPLNMPKPHDRLFPIGGLIGVICLVIAVGILLVGNPWLGFQKEGPPQPQKSARFRIMDKKAETALPSSNGILSAASPRNGTEDEIASPYVPGIKTGTAIPHADTQAEEAKGSTLSLLERKGEGPASVSLYRHDPVEGGPGEQGRVVVARNGDSLSKIIMRTYGKYNSKLLSSVMLENPEIRSPDQIFVDQQIKMPEIGKIDESNKLSQSK